MFKSTVPLINVIQEGMFFPDQVPNPGFEWTGVKLHKQANGNNNNSSRSKNNINIQQQQRRRHQTRSLEAVGSCVPIDTGKLFCCQERQIGTGLFVRGGRWLSSSEEKPNIQKASLRGGHVAESKGGAYTTSLVSLQ